jgi:hypothetical protein
MRHRYRLEERLRRYGFDSKLTGYDWISKGAEACQREVDLQEAQS